MGPVVWARLVLKAAIRTTGARHDAVTHLAAVSRADSASPSDEIAVFQAYVDRINSERETIWARHNALLVANSLIVPRRRYGPINGRLW